MEATVGKTVLVLFLYYFCTSLTSANNSLHCGNCIHPEAILVCVCSVSDGAATVWKGSIFNCPSNGNQIVLRHSSFENKLTVTRACNDGAVVAYSTDVMGNIYSSQLNITVSPEMHNGTVECIQDLLNATSVTVGTYTLRLATGNCCNTVTYKGKCI